MILPCAATHGAANTVAGVTLLLTAEANPLIGGIVGLVDIACFGLVGALLWLVVVPIRNRLR